MGNKSTNLESCHLRMNKGLRYQLKLIASQEGVSMQAMLEILIKQYKRGNK